MYVRECDNRISHSGLLWARDVRILKFFSPRQSADFDQGSAVSPRPRPREILDPRPSASALIMNRPASSH